MSERDAEDVRGHICHALGCSTPVPPKMFMCRRHWYMVPKVLQRRVWATYRPGQEIDKHPSREYLLVTQEAIDFVAQQTELAAQEAEEDHPDDVWVPRKPTRNKGSQQASYRCIHDSPRYLCVLCEERPNDGLGAAK